MDRETLKIAAELLAAAEEQTQAPGAADIRPWVSVRVRASDLAAVARAAREAVALRAALGDALTLCFRCDGKGFLPSVWGDLPCPKCGHLHAMLGPAQPGGEGPGVRDNPFKQVTWRLKGGGRSMPHLLVPWGMLKTLCGKAVGDDARYLMKNPAHSRLCRQCRNIEDYREAWRVSPDGEDR